VDLRPVGKSGEPAGDQGIGRGDALFVLGTELGILLSAQLLITSGQPGLL
jgi:hypothetical protein